MVIQWIVFSIFALAICSFPILYNIFGKEDGCGRSLFDKWKARKKKQ